MHLKDDFGVTITAEGFEKRFLELHKQLFASTEQEFNDVAVHVYKPPEGFYQVDHSFIYENGNWHLYYGLGEMKYTEEWIRHFRSGDVEAANKVCLEPGNGHAVGPTLSNLEFKEHVFHPPQGRFDLASRGVCSFYRYDGKIGMLYDVRGENYIGMSTAYTEDLSNWVLSPDNPKLGAPDWAKAGSTVKDPHVLQVDDTYLIYYIVMDKRGYCSVALATTKDWDTFEDEGVIFQAPPMLRGTMGIESPAVVRRDDLWHLFFTFGPGLWHSVSMSPKGFVASRPTSWDVGTGFYYMGPFHATEVIDDHGTWYLTTDRKEETRRLNRVAGRLCYRGSYEDEKTLEEGLYLSEIEWKGDQPIYVKPRGK